MKLYRFEDIDATLKLIPLCVRRALDLAGSRLSLSTWHTLELEVRGELAECGSAESVALDRVLGLLARLSPTPARIEAVADPDAARVPLEVSEALGSSAPLASGTWASLTALDRYVLFKLATGGKVERLRAAYPEIVGQSGVSSHLGPQGGVRMVSTSKKAISERRALAESAVTLGDTAFKALVGNTAPKGDVLGAARLAGIMAAKKTSELIPLCHPIALSQCEISLEPDEATRQVRILAAVTAMDRTGVEMEATVAASVAGLTVYDMLKGLDRRIELGPTRLLEKTGGKSGDFQA
jgi:cyclic pyranopterin phosphate synthase